MEGVVAVMVQRRFPQEKGAKNGLFSRKFRNKSVQVGATLLGVG